jgi:hypothetical protein
MLVIVPYINSADIDSIMEKTIIRTKPPLYKDNRFLNAKLLNFDLPVLIKKMKRSNSWALGELSTSILLKSPKKQILLTALHESTQIQSFQSNDSVTFHIIEGCLNFYTKNQSVVLEKGQLLTISENIDYRMTSIEDTVFLMTILKK